MSSATAAPATTASTMVPATTSTAVPLPRPKVEKVEVLADAGERTATIVLHEEDHTMGNALRYVLSKQTTTDFAGYSIPHPSEPILNFRLQTRSNARVRPAFAAGCELIVNMCDHMERVWDEACARAERDGVPVGTSDDNATLVDAVMESID